MPSPWFAFVLGVFATWRVAHMLAHEDGPWDLVLRLRGAVGDGVFGHLLDCFYCLSLWIAAPIAFTVADDPIGWVIAWLAVSGAACLLDRLVPASPAVLQPINDPGETDELLRTETGRAGVERGESPGGDFGGHKEHHAWHG